MGYFRGSISPNDVEHGLFKEYIGLERNTRSSSDFGIAPDPSVFGRAQKAEQSNGTQLDSLLFEILRSDCK